MKHFVIITMLSLLMLGRMAYAQKPDTDTLGEITFEELKDNDKTSQYFAVGGGVIGNFLYFNADNINSKIPSEFMVTKFTSPLFVSGGQGFITFFFKNVRLGFSAAIGTQTAEDTLVSSAGTIKRQVDFSSSFNGLTVDYAIPVVKGLTVLPGFEVGFGAVRFERYDGYSEKDTFTHVKADTNLVNGNIAMSRWFFQPTLNIEYAITTFTMVRGSVGYNVSLPGSWVLNRTTDLTDPPKEVNSGGLVIGFGVFFGLFRNE